MSYLNTGQLNVTNNKYHAHQQLIKRFSVLLGKELPKARIFGRVTGLFYAKRKDGYVPTKINDKGMSDAYIMYDCGACIIYLDCEFKTGQAVQNKYQKQWQQYIESMNGFYLIIRDEHQGIKDIRNYLKGLNIL